MKNREWRKIAKKLDLDTDAAGNTVVTVNGFVKVSDFPKIKEVATDILNGRER